jgi:hypothetical protein
MMVCADASAAQATARSVDESIVGFRCVCNWSIAGTAKSPNPQSFAVTPKGGFLWENLPLSSPLQNREFPESPLWSTFESGVCGL